MKISPTLTEVKEIAKTGKYDILPVSCEILSDFITPIEAMRILQNVSTHIVICLNQHKPMKPGEDIHFWDMIQSLRLTV